MVSCIFQDILGVTRLWPPVFFEIFWSDPVVASCIFRDIFGVTRLWPPVFFGIFLE